MPAASYSSLPASPAAAQRAGTEQLRRHSLALVLSALREEAVLSHTALSERTGLASATVTAVTGDLERLGAIERQDQPASGGRGRPRVLFARRRRFSHAVAVQISSDALHYGLADYGGTMIDRFSRPRDIAAGTPDSLLSDMGEAIARLIQRSRLEPAEVGAISLSSKGIVDADGGRLVWSPVFGERSVEFSALLEHWPAATLFVSNETLLVAHAAARKRMAESPAEGGAGLIALSLGHSIGLGIARIEEGQFSVSAPNFGHMLNAVDDRLCRCGLRGCIEATAGFYGILRIAFQVPPNTIPARFVPLTEIEKIALSARQGTRMAQHAFRQAGLALGQGLSRVLSLHENLPVIVTGPGTRFYDLMQPGIEEGLRQSLHVRLNGLPKMTVVTDESSLVFAGHVDRALTAVDQRVVGLR
ncbi:ROK family transcriptional regulator [Rhizobium straminoryzae]|uniref:ROK family transcriptional regulator n=1 Tax=Rhizobium straminoryzae TaxID=1387186 RepID=A0A549TBT8_9HYPH|nr:ROK family transcriptional regulator [Rhizobium straminoryzae]TRL39356.1 ROK family transcriptional regulator [Rhizobium straminoryzae]